MEHWWPVIITAVFQLASFVIGGLVIAFRITKGAAVTATLMGANITALQADVKALQDEIKRLAEVVIKQTEQGGRIDELFRRTERLEKWWDELRHGEGMVLPMRRSPFEAS